MKKFITFIVGLLVAGVSADARFSDYRGVWASDSAEAVITDSVCIFYAHIDSTMQATLEAPSSEILHKTVFAPGGLVSFPEDVRPLDIVRSKNRIVIDGQTLVKVEDIETTTPYEMKECRSKYDVGDCLQQWRLGAAFGTDTGVVYCEVNTNRHMAVYMVNPTMTYIRAAATRNNNNGTLFFQNIRMIKNSNTGEYTMAIEPDNLAAARDDLEIDNSQFQPDKCTFTPGGGIYWSLISFGPDKILINGCGETYHVDRPVSPDNCCEWIKFEPYGREDYFLR